MWSGGRFLKTLAVAGGLIGSPGTVAGQTPLCNGQHPGNPALVSGAASCVYNEVNGVGQTLIDLSDTSIIRWDRLGLGNSASSLQFSWSGDPAGNATVINRVEGSALSSRPIEAEIAGTVEFFDGNLVVTHPNSSLTISGTVAARSLIFATHRLDPEMERQLLNGNAADFTGSLHPLNVIDGKVVATNGDAILAGRVVLSSATGNPGEEAAKIEAPNGSVRIFGGENFRLLPGGPQRLQVLPGAGGGSVVTSKTIRAGRSVEISASHGIANAGGIEANQGAGQIFLRVDNGGQISNSGTIRGNVLASPPVGGPGQLIDPDGPDSPSALSTGISRFPVVSRPGEAPSGRRVVVYENAPTAGSASARPDRAGGNARPSPRSTQVASNTRGSAGGKAPLARGRSFFGLRGGTSATKTSR